MRHALTIAAVVAALACPTAAQDVDTPERRFQRAWYQELAEARYEDARTTYEALAADASLDAALRAKALFRVGVCLQRLGQRDEAVKVFERVAREFAQVKAVAAEAQRQAQGESDAQAAFREKLQGLIVQLTAAAGPDQRRGAVHRLREVGPEAAPLVLPVLASSSFEGSQAAAGLLVDYAAADLELVPTLLTAVAEGDPVVRKALLAEIEGSGSGPLLARLIEAERTDVRAAAVRGLRQVGSTTENLAALTRLAQAGPEEVRVEAIRTLGALRAPAALPVLVRMLGAADAASLDAAVRSLWTYCFEPSDFHESIRPRQVEGTSVAIQALAGDAPAELERFLSTSYVADVAGHEAEVARALENALSRLGGPGRLLALGLVTRVASTEAGTRVLGAALQGSDAAAAQFVAAAIAAERCQAPVAGALREVVANTNDDVLRKLAQRALYQLDALDDLVAVLPRLDDSLQRSVVHKIGKRTAHRLLLAALEHFAAVGASARASLLEEVADRQLAAATAAIARGLVDEDAWVAFYALRAARAVPGAALGEPLATMIADPRTEARFAEHIPHPAGGSWTDARGWATLAVKALEAAGGPAVRRGLEAALRLHTTGSRWEGARALLALGDRAAGPAVLRELATEPEGSVQQLLLEAVRRFAPDEASTAILAFLRRRDTLGSSQSAAVAELAKLPAAQAITTLRQVLEGDYGALGQAAAAAALPRIEHPDVRELILSSAWSADASVRHAALEGLRALPLDPSLTPRLVELLRHPDQKARQLTRELLAMCESEAAPVRLAAVQALGRLGSRDALPALVRLRKDPDTGVRKAVETVLDALSAPAEAPK